MKNLLLVVAIALAWCAQNFERPNTASAAIEKIDEAEMRALMAPLASDEFEGRMPGTAGETKTLAYVTQQLHKVGVIGASREENSWFQTFEMESGRKITPERAEELMKSPNIPKGQVTFLLRGSEMPKFKTYNVIGKIPGQRPDGKAVLIMGHWDHLGICRPEGEEDRICNGAVDNASGIAAILAVAKRVTQMKLDRDVWIVLTSGEEWGLFGAKAFAADPTLDLSTIVAAFNLDTIAVAPAGMPVAMVAEKNSPLEPMVIEAAKVMGRTWDGDEEAYGFIGRQDGAALYEKGVPMIMAGGSFSDMTKLQAFLGGRYHGPDDELDDEIELGGAVEDANLHVELIRRAASRNFNPPRKKVVQAAE